MEKEGEVRGSRGLSAVNITDPLRGTRPSTQPSQHVPDLDN